jgi:2-oxoglutarate dehydrogenase E2 component (dihydrolipoamide succinyltransferase)
MPVTAVYGRVVQRERDADMTVELKVPSPGESITEVTIAGWLKGEGEVVTTDEPVVEIDSDKSTLEVGAPAAGVISRLMKKEGDTAQVGEVIALIEENGKAATKGEKASAAKAPSAAKKEKEKTTEKRVMPAAKRLAAEKGVDADSLEGTGPGGRVLKEDVQRAETKPERPEPASARPSSAPAFSGGARETEVVRMTTLRKRIAQRLVEAQQTAAILTTFNEVDMHAVVELRRAHKEAFEQRYGIKLGMMSFFVKAAVDALRFVPQVNARIEDDSIVYHNYQDIGVAVGGGKGLVVPVLRNAERLSFAEIELAIADFAKRAQSNAITPDEMQGGTFTISNGGIYGSLLSTPILNPPQSGILGMHAIQDRPVVRDGQIVIRPMMYVAMSYDHRLVDGREAVTFLKRIKECVENPTRMLMEV